MRRFPSTTLAAFLVPLVLIGCNETPTSLDHGPQPAKGGQGKGKKLGQITPRSALQFDGVDDGAETPDADALDLTTTFTIEGWIKPEDPTAWQHVVSKWGLSVTASFNVSFDPGGSGRIRLVTHTPGAIPDNTVLASSQPLQADMWQHFAFVFEDGEARLYLGGQLDTQASGMNVPQISATLLSLGRQKSLQGFVGQHFDGVMDEIRLWHVARSEKQISRNMGKEISPKSRGLVAYWRMNEGNGQVAADETSNGHDMQLGDLGGADAADPVWALKWETLAAMPTAVFQARGATDGSRAYALGGTVPPATEVALNQIFDPSPGTWSLGTSFSNARSFTFAAGLPDGVHMVAGFGVENAQRSDHQVYDPNMDSWSFRASLPVPDHAGVAEAIGERMYVVTFSGLHIYDASTDTWSAGTPRPIQGIQATSAAIDGQVYVAGGSCCAGSVTFDALHRYDPTTDTWATLAPIPGQRSALGGGTINAQFCVFGGRLANPSPTGNAFPDTFCYDPSTDSWSHGPDMLTPRVEMASVEVGSAVYALAGRTPTALANATAERLVPDVPF